MHSVNRLAWMVCVVNIDFAVLFLSAERVFLVRCFHDCFLSCIKVQVRLVTYNRYTLD